MGESKRMEGEAIASDMVAQELYKKLNSPEFNTKDYKRADLDENMEVIDTLVVDYWKPRYLLNHNTRRAYEFMNWNAHLVGVEDNDIDWDTIRDVPEKYIDRIKTRNALFPSFIYRFKNGVAEVKWQINPDGRYWMDDDGYGMTPDEEYNLYGFINTEGKVVVPFRHISDYKELEGMRSLAEKMAGNK